MNHSGIFRGKIMQTKWPLQFLKNQPEVSSDVFLAETVHAPAKNLVRDGLFFSVFNKMFDEKSSGVPHVLCGYFSAFNQDKYFYQFFSTSPLPQKETLLFFHLNPEDFSLEMLDDVIEWISEFPGKLKAFYHYEIDAANIHHQLYLSKFYQKLSALPGGIPDAVSALDIYKQSSFEGVSLVEAGTQWKCLDNQLVHVVLSKGGYLVQPDTKMNCVVVEEIMLSPFHKLQIVERTQGAAENGYEEDLKKLNYFQNPQDMKIFKHLIYRNIFKGLNEN